MFLRFIIFFFSMFICAILPASAGAIAINPTQVHVTKAFASNIISLNNSGTTPVRMQILIYSWEQKPGEKMITKNTDEILAYPSQFTLAPGTSRQIRVGTAKPLQAQEKTYRLVFRELKETEENRTQGAHITLLTNIDIPVFVRLENSVIVKPVIEIKSTSFSTDKLSVVLHNSSLVHEQLQNLEFVAYDAQNKVISKMTKDGWYILADADQSYEFPLSGTLCKQIKTASLVLNSHLSGSHVIMNLPINCRGK